MYMGVVNYEVCQKIAAPLLRVPKFDDKKDYSGLESGMGSCKHGCERSKRCMATLV